MAGAQDALVGLAALALLPLIGLRLRRGMRDGRLPLYRSYRAAVTVTSDCHS